MELSIEAGLNLEPYDSGNPLWAWRARCRFPPNLCVSKVKFFSAALTDRLNSNSGFKGCGHGVAILFCSVEMRFAWG